MIFQLIYFNLYFFLYLSTNDIPTPKSNISFSFGMSGFLFVVLIISSTLVFSNTSNITLEFLRGPLWTTTTSNMHACACNVGACMCGMRVCSCVSGRLPLVLPSAAGRGGFTWVRRSETATERGEVCRPAESSCEPSCEKSTHWFDTEHVHSMRCIG